MARYVITTPKNYAIPIPNEWGKQERSIALQGHIGFSASGQQVMIVDRCISTDICPETQQEHKNEDLFKPW